LTQRRFVPLPLRWIGEALSRILDFVGEPPPELRSVARFGPAKLRPLRSRRGLDRLRIGLEGPQPQQLIVIGARDARGQAEPFGVRIQRIGHGNL
jgi:hypothetical protein